MNSVFPFLLEGTSKMRSTPTVFLEGIEKAQQFIAIPAAKFVYNFVDSSWKRLLFGDFSEFWLEKAIDLP